MRIFRNIVLVFSVCTCITFFAPGADGEELRGKYCYSGLESEPLLVAEEASSSLALRNAIKGSKTFQTLTNEVEDCDLKKEILEIAAGCVAERTKIIKQEVLGRTVCTELTTHIDIKALKSLIERKLRKVDPTKGTEFKGLIPNKAIRVLSYKRKGEFVTILYQAIEDLGYKSVVITIHCFDKDGDLIESNSAFFPESPLSRNNIRWASLPVDKGTVTFELKIN